MQHYFTRLEKAFEECWDSPALCNFKGECFSFGQTAEHIGKLHVFFCNSGIEKGDKISICAKNSARWGITFLAANTFEAVAVPILADFTAESIESLVDHSESVLLFTVDDIWSKLNPERMPLLKAVVSVNSFKLLFSRDESANYASNNIDRLFAEKYPNGFALRDVSYPKDNLDKLAVINYTSGTTSAPKGVMLTYRNLSSNVEFGQKRIPSHKGDTLLSMLPMAHMYGMMFELIYPLCGCTSIYYLGKTPTPSILLGALSKVRPYLVITVPLVMEKIYRNSIKPVVSKGAAKFFSSVPGIRNLIFKKIREKLLSSLGGNIRMIIMGGAALNPEVESWFRKIRLPYTVGYGMTEAAPLLGFEDWDKFVPKSCGKAVDRCQVRIDSEDPRNIPGEIQAKGDNIMMGYYKNPSATKAAFTDDGWMNTGDLGVIDSGGNIFIRGRSKNMILSSNGQNIYPEEIEAVLNNCQYVLESVVIDRGSKLVALVYPDSRAMEKDGLDNEAIADQMEQMRNLVNKGLPSYSRISKVEIMSAPFEKTPKMSIKRFLYM